MPRKGDHAPVWASQNFLTGRAVIAALLRKTSLSATDHVVEIGPGKGHITALLVKRCKTVTAVEIDPALCHKLKTKFNDAANLALHCRDFIRWPLPSGPYKVFANIPFNRTTDILRKLTEERNPPSEAWLTMEKGAAMRFSGLPRENLRSLSLKPRFDIEIVHKFRREDFHPKPGADAVLIRLHRKPAPDIPPAQWQSYQRFVSEGLQAGGLRRLFKGRRLSAALREAGVSNAASANMLYVQWLCLFRCHRRHTPGK